MSTWRREALEALPELRFRIEASPSPMSLWIELYLQFEDAVRSGDASLVGRLLKYAAWCCSELSGSLPNDTSTAAVCAFYEHLPSHKEFWPSFGTWFSPDEFTRLLPVFAHHLSPEDLEALKVAYHRGRPNNSFMPKPLRDSA